MLHFSRGKMIAVLLACLAGLLTTLPNFFSKETVAGWPKILSHQLNLGLDLRGGAHLLLAMDPEEIRKDWLNTLREDARKALRDQKIGLTSAGIQGQAIQVKLVKPEDMDASLKQLKTLITPVGNQILGQVGGTIDVTKADDITIVVKPTEQGLRERITNAASASIETVRRRVDLGGNIEPNIVRQGTDRILLQVPGFDDTKKLKELIGSTAKLTFHEVHPSASVEDAKLTQVPLGFKIYPGIEKLEEGGAPEYLLRETPVVPGDDLVDAQPGFDQQTGEAVINFRFNQSGARKFGAYTQENIGRPFAIVLDDKVISAPVIRTAILGGSGQISGNFTVESSTLLATQLRSGALPAKLTIVEERTVGPSLGADSISAGKLAALIGTALVALFMTFAYGTFGFFALIAVLFNIAMIIGVMSLLGSTLTLPGIAGLVLTVGMAVDANVLIYERIREELRSGRSPIAAIEGGFARAFGTILDSNLTTLIAGLVMFWLGSGPVRGFAVTLSLGIFTTVFTAFVVTRLLVSWWLQGQKGKKVPTPL